MTDTISRMAQAIYTRDSFPELREKADFALMPESVKEEYRLLARAALGALQGEEMEEAVEAFREAWSDHPGTWREADVAGIEAAAPYLRAPLAAEVERLKAERDEYKGSVEKYAHDWTVAVAERDAARTVVDLATQVVNDARCLVQVGAGDHAARVCLDKLTALLFDERGQPRTLTGGGNG